MKIVRLDRAYWPRGGWGHWCPGCDAGHEIDTEAPNASGAMWKFDGDQARPSFTPSVNIRWGKYADPNHQDDWSVNGVCHYFITAGQIQFCGDCTHGFAGRTVEMPDIPPGRYVTSVRKMAAILQCKNCDSPVDGQGKWIDDNEWHGEHCDECPDCGARFKPVR